MTPPRIEGKVARILNRRELVLNVGTDKGVTLGMRFAVLNPRGAEILDPDTQENLGSIEVPKVVVEAVRVDKRLTVVRTYRKYRKNIGGSASGTAAIMKMFEPPKYIELAEDLKTNERTYQEELDEDYSYVKVGDPAVQIIADEFE